MPAFRERRQTIRIAVQGMLTIETATPGPSLRLVDVGTGGFGVRSRTPLPLDIVTSYRFATGDRKWSAFFEARAVHCKLVQAESKTAHEYATGLTFVNAESPAVQRDIMALMDHAMNFVAFS